MENNSTVVTHQELGELKELLTQVRICLAKMEAQQNTFKNSLDVFREERLKTYDIMTEKIKEIEKDVQKLDKKLTYASGFVTAAATFLSFIISAVTKKLGIA